MLITPIIGTIYYSKDTHTRILRKTTRVITNNMKIMLDLDINKVKKLPFKEIMEIINANNGFFYNKNSKKKLNRYAEKVSRRIVRRSERKPKRSGKTGGIFLPFLS